MHALNNRKIVLNLHAKCIKVMSYCNCYQYRKAKMLVSKVVEDAGGATNMPVSVLCIHARTCPCTCIYMYRRSGNFRVKKLSYEKFSCKNFS